MELEQLLPMWAVICPLVFLGAVMDAVAGGGGLLSLPAYLLAGLGPHMAIGTNKLGNLPGVATSALMGRQCCPPPDPRLRESLVRGPGANVPARGGL